MQTNPAICSCYAFVSLFGRGNTKVICNLSRRNTMFYSVHGNLPKALKYRHCVVSFLYIILYFFLQLSIAVRSLFQSCLSVVQKKVLFFSPLNLVWHHIFANFVCLLYGDGHISCKFHWDENGHSSDCRTKLLVCQHNCRGPKKLKY